MFRWHVRPDPLTASPGHGRCQIPKELTEQAADNTHSKSRGKKKKKFPFSQSTLWGLPTSSRHCKKQCGICLPTNESLWRNASKSTKFSHQVSLPPPIAPDRHQHCQDHMGTAGCQPRRASAPFLKLGKTDSARPSQPMDFHPAIPTASPGRTIFPSAFSHHLRKVDNTQN